MGDTFGNASATNQIPMEILLKPTLLRSPGTLGRARGLHMVASPVAAQLVQLQLIGDLHRKSLDIDAAGKSQEYHREIHLYLAGG